MARSQHITNPSHAKAFIFAGKAVVTLKSVATGQSYTYKIDVSDDGEVHFVYLLTGPNNTQDYTYIGMIKNNRFTLTAKSKIKWADQGPVAGINWFLKNLLKVGGISTNVEVWHEGKCGRCRRALTTVASLHTGFGPDCAEHLGIIWCEPVNA